ncbi:DUF5676 family membrane protein [Pseudomonas sp. N040]|uniref:DUF5676 family membrane protein n=1 Tax=Pseudomonas sp. N040 TaxID=2785325 RepID=UPI0018A3012E|nr:DUF5676 family membrane protein [Pseudomonas sp. N040]MBF7731712.1 hypothetical protein [Pseudomonas sp. N040]MBW7015356.1 hypothetical protein [Pseudomonas sp. N040]
MNAPWKTGLTLALTMAISYSVCALLYALWPTQGIAFLNALFHGLDFGRLQAPQAYGVATFVGPLLVLSGWGALVGTLFAWLHCRLHGNAQ